MIIPCIVSLLLPQKFRPYHAQHKSEGRPDCRCPAILQFGHRSDILKNQVKYAPGGKQHQRSYYFILSRQQAVTGQRRCDADQAERNQYQHGFIRRETGGAQISEGVVALGQVLQTYKKASSRPVLLS